MLRVTYIGHATLLIEVGGRRILTDPNFDPALGKFLRRVSSPGIPLSERVLYPAMGAEAMAGDCRALTAMILQWLRPNRIAALHVRIKPTFEALRTKLSGWALDNASPPPAIDQLLALLSLARSTIAKGHTPTIPPTEDLALKGKQ